MDDPAPDAVAGGGELPTSAAWSHRGLRTGFEVVFIRRVGGYRFEGASTAVQDGRCWTADYEIRLDAGWTTRSARVTSRSQAGRHTVTLEHDGSGRWHRDGVPQPELDGCLDVDLEQSALTNAFPVHRLGLAVGGRASAPAAFVPFATGVDAPVVERLEQAYVRLDDVGTGRRRYDYCAPAFGSTTQLTYDEHGLVVDYPGIAHRTA